MLCRSQVTVDFLGQCNRQSVSRRSIHGLAIKIVGSSSLLHWLDVQILEVMLQCSARENVCRWVGFRPHTFKFGKVCRAKAKDDKQATVNPTLLRPETFPFGDTITPEDSLEDMGSLYELTNVSMSPKVFTMPRWQSHKRWAISILPFMRYQEQAGR
jgi:hypothetical protein